MVFTLATRSALEPKSLSLNKLTVYISGLKHATCGHSSELNLRTFDYMFDAQSIVPRSTVDLADSPGF